MIKKIFIAFLVLGFFTIQSSEAFGFKNKKITVCKPVYTVESGLHGGYQIMKCGKTYGIKNSFSYPVVAPKYSKMINLDDNFVKVYVNKKQCGLLTYLGKTYIVPKYDDIAISKIQLSEQDADYLFYGKRGKVWFFIDEGKEIPLEKLKKGEIFKPVFTTTLHHVPHKVDVDGNKYRLLMGNINMGELLSNSPVKVYISSKLPKSLDLKMADLALVSLFQKK